MKLTHGYYHLIAILTVAIWGLTFIATKVLINHGLTPQEIFFYRFLIAYIGIWAISPKHLFADNLKDELWLVAGGVFGGSLYFFTENTALGITQASNVAFIICTAPLLTTILSLIFYKSEKATKGLIYGSLLALIGVGLVVFNGSVVLKLKELHIAAIKHGLDEVLIYAFRILTSLSDTPSRCNTLCISAKLLNRWDCYKLTVKTICLKICL